jgi:hypothetical protein
VQWYVNNVSDTSDYLIGELANINGIGVISVMYAHTS